MDITKAAAKIRLVYYLNMLDVVNVAYQIKLINGDKADMLNKSHLKECIDCYERLGVKFPKAFIDFKNEGV